MEIDGNELLLDEGFVDRFQTYWNMACGTMQSQDTVQRSGVSPMDGKWM